MQLCVQLPLGKCHWFLQLIQQVPRPRQRDVLQGTGMNSATGCHFWWRVKQLRVFWHKTYYLDLSGGFGKSPMTFHVNWEWFWVSTVQVDPVPNARGPAWWVKVFMFGVLRCLKHLTRSGSPQWQACFLKWGWIKNDQKLSHNIFGRDEDPVQLLWSKDSKDSSEAEASTMACGSWKTRTGPIASWSAGGDQTFCRDPARREDREAKVTSFATKEWIHAYDCLRKMVLCSISHRIHVWYIYANIWGIWMVNVTI